MTLKPRVVLDLGCGTGAWSSRLQVRYPDAAVLALDASEQMIAYTKQHAPKALCICADAGKLPLANQSVDLIFANLLLPWYEDMKSLLHECYRILRPDGLIIFTALGPDTLNEWKDILPPDAAPALIDIHDIGDLMLQLKFADPVLDVDRYTVTYRELGLLFKELQSSGMLAANMEEINLSEIPPNEEGVWAVTYEVIFAHAFAPASSDEVSASADGVARIPLAHLRRRLQG